MSKLRDLPDGVEYRDGGWYRLPNGVSVRGRHRVEAALNGEGRRAVARNDEATAFTLQRLDFLRQAGKQYSGNRDVYDVAGYEKNPDYADYWGYYDRHPIAGRIVDMPAQTTWRHAPEIVEPDQEDGTEFTKAVAELIDRLGLWARLERVDRLSRIGQYAVLLIGAKDVATADDLQRPLGQLSGPDDIAYLAHYSQRAATVDKWVTDPADERYGLPELYRIDLSRNSGMGGGRTGFRAGSVLVHETRVIHVAEDTLEDDVFGRPVLRRVLNTVCNDEKVDAAAAEAFWQLADKILQLKIDPEATGVDVDAVEEDMRALFHDLRRHALFQGGELSWLGGESSDPTGISEVLATKMAAGANIPKRILFGSERGELASSQDERNYFGMVSERQEHHAEPNVLRVLLDRLVEHGALPRPGEDGYDAIWPALYVPTETEKAERNKNNASAAKDLTPLGGDPYELVDVDDDGNVTLRPSAEVWDERDREPGEPLEVVDPMGEGPEPPAAGGDDDEGVPEDMEDAA